MSERQQIVDYLSTASHQFTRTVAPGFLALIDQIRNGAHLTEESAQPSECPELAKIVDGILALHVQFDGPPMAYFEGTNPDSRRWMYDCLCSGGIKEQGAASPRFKRDEALARYDDALRAYIAPHMAKDWEAPDGAKRLTIAWRHRPVLERYVKGGFRVYSRLAVL